MTWREFQLRRKGYERQQMNEWRKVREIAYWSGAGSAFDPKKTKIDKFMPFEFDEISTASESALNKLAEEQRKYREKYGG